MDNSLLIIMFAAIIIIGLIMLVVIGTTLRRPQALNKEMYRTRIAEIERLLEGKGISATHMAIMEADKLCDQALKERGVKGQTMGERLKNGKSLMNNIDRVWAAHKLRNRIAHENGVNVPTAKAKQAVAVFKRCLKDLGAI